MAYFRRPFPDIFDAKDVAGAIRREAFGAWLVLLRIGARDEISDRAVFGAADPGAAAAARIAQVLALDHSYNAQDQPFGEAGDKSNHQHGVPVWPTEAEDRCIEVRVNDEVEQDRGNWPHQEAQYGDPDR